VLRIATTSILLLFLAETSSVEAQPPVQWPVHNRILGKHDKASKDISGIACSTTAGFPRRCLVIDDNLQAAQQIVLHDGWLEAGALVPLIDNTWRGKPLELDGEGVAFAEGVFYVIGSHGHPRDEDHKLDPGNDRELISARIAAASQIIPLRVESDGALVRQSPLNLSSAIAAQPELQAYAEKRLEGNGLTIEGIAVKGDSLFAGFRGPNLPGARAAILQVSIVGLRGGAGSAARLFKLPLGKGQGVRDMAPFNDGFLVLAGPTASGAGSYQLFSWDGVSDEGVRALGDITAISAASGTRKPEAILPLDGTKQAIRVLILFDGAEMGDPTVLTVQLP
jgi:hypothetical protein